MNDNETTLSALRKAISEFVEERDWSQFHAPKNLAMSLAIEAAELMEHFQWIDSPQSRVSNLKPEQLEQIGQEIADVLAYTLALVNELDLDLTTIFLAKLQSNRSKYPANEFRGRFGSSDSNPPTIG